MKGNVVAVLGNPNAGKTTLFNGLTGSRQQIGNWPGVTVEKKTGTYEHAGQVVKLVDLPGTYSLEGAGASPDEQVAQQYLLSGDADLVINVVDAANLERNLYLTTQLMALNVPRLIILNMMDRVREHGMSINIELLSRRLGCPVIPVSARKRKDIDYLQDAITEYLEQPESTGLSSLTPDIFLDNTIHESLKVLGQRLEKEDLSSPVGRQWQSMQLLEGSAMGLGVSAELMDIAARLREKLEKSSSEDIDILLADSRYRFIHKVCRECIYHQKKASRALSDQIDKVVLNRVLGVPLFFMVMYLMFMITIHIGSAFIDFFEITVGALVVDSTAAFLQNIDAPGWSIALLAYGLGGGIKTVASFIPVIACLYLCLSVLEGSGYMSRAAFVMDRFMGMIGLPGKAFVPLLIGFGCNVPAIMATRTLGHERDRKLAIMMNPFMSCGARLPVYALFAAAFFPASGHNLIFGLYLTGFAVAVATGLIMKCTLLRGQNASYVMELPVYQLPTLRNVLLQTWERLNAFITGAGKVIVLVVMILGVLGHMNVSGQFMEHSNAEDSVLSEVGRQITPVFKPMGVTEDNWPAAVGLFTGIFAKEAVIGTLNSLYGQLAGYEAVADDEPAGLLETLAGAVRTVPENLQARLGGGMTGAIDMSVADIGDMSKTTAALDINDGMLVQMQQRFGSSAAATAYLLFVLLYIPCVAAMGAVHREAGMRWMLFVGGWSTFVAYAISTSFYQVLTFTEHPLFASSWLMIMAGLFALVIAALRYQGRKRVIDCAAGESDVTASSIDARSSV